MEGLRERVKPEISFDRDMKHGLKYYEDLQKVLDGRATVKIKHSFVTVNEST